MASVWCNSGGEAEIGIFNVRLLGVRSKYVYVISVILLLFVQTKQILQFPVINVLEIFGEYVLSNLSPISPNVSSVRT